MADSEGTKSYFEPWDPHMARWRAPNPRPKTQEEWEAAGAEAILDLLDTRLVVPWAEVEARIAFAKGGWNGFPVVQPIQLSAAKRALVADGAIVEEATEHTTAVSTIRRPFTEGRKREVERLRGERRKDYRRFLSWAEDYETCGRQAERNVLSAAKQVASEAGLYVPPQSPGRVDKVAGANVAGTLDVVVDVLDLGSVSRAASLVFEVKNVRHMLYPWMQEVWQCLVRAARLAEHVPTLPVLACVRASWSNWNMAQDLGFFQVQFARQVFSPKIDSGDFDATVAEFAFIAERDDAPDPYVADFLTKTLRRNPPPSPPAEDIAYWERNLDRFAAVAPHILNFESLAGELSDDSRRRVFNAFKANVSGRLLWDTVRGW